MSKCYTFDEWFEICHELASLYRSCLKLCLESRERTPDYIEKCLDECDEDVKNYGMKKHGLREEQAWICAHME